MAARLILIAHAETGSARSGSFPLGDEPLAPRGLAAARVIAGSLPRCDEVLTSPAIAACETAQALGLVAVVDHALRDLDVGGWRGRALADIAGENAAHASAFIADPGFAEHGGESIGALVERVSRWLDVRKAARQPMIAVTHPPVMRAAVVAILNAPAAAFWHLDAAPLQMLTLTTDGRRWALRSFAAPAGSP